MNNTSKGVRTLDKSLVAQIILRLRGEALLETGINV